jgi:hypothetical protein
LKLLKSSKIYKEVLILPGKEARKEGKNMKRPIIATLFLAILLVSTISSAYVIRDEKKEREEEWQKYQEYKADYIKMNDLKGYEDYIYEPNLARNFGFYPNSRYVLPRDVWNAKYNPPLQGEVYSTEYRRYGSSLNQPSAVKHYADEENGRLSGFVMGDLNGVYFDHPDAKTVYGHISHSNYISPYPGAVDYGYGYGYAGEDLGNGRFYARVADQVSDDYYIIAYY